MGTRADFYIQKPTLIPDEIVLEWLGSVAWDGNEWEDQIKRIKSKAEFTLLIEKIQKERDDWTDPSKGWPLPWDDSHLTDYAYVFTDKGSVYVFGKDVTDEPSEEEYDKREKSDIFPNMADKKNVAFGNRSGVMIIGVSK